MRRSSISNGQAAHSDPAPKERWNATTLFRILLVLALLVLPLLTIQSVRMGHEVVQRLEGLSTAATDNIQWTLSQAEVDHLKFRAAISEVRSPKGVAQLRRQFDIYYSRIATFVESPLFSDLRKSVDGGELLGRLEQRLEQFALLIDVDDDSVVQNLPKISDLMVGNGDDVRDLALFGVVIQVEATEAKRLHLFSILLRLAWVVLALFLALAITALLLGWMYRRGRVMAEERSKAASRMEAMISSSLDAILMVDKSGRIQAFNDAAEAIFGYDRTEAIGAMMEDLIIPTHLREAHRAGMMRYLTTGEERVAGKGRVKLEAQRKSGEIFPIEVSLSISHSLADTVFVGFIRDISDRIEAEEELRRARDDALAGERAKANLLTVMSHEMRTPLTGILGAIDLLEGTHPDHEQIRYLNAMRVSGELLLHHVNDVLQLSSLEAGVAPEPLQSFSVLDLVSGLVDSQKANARSRGNELTLQYSLGDEDGVVAGRPRALQQALLNLIGNAIKFTRDGAVLVDIHRGQSADLMEIHVSDTGQGIETSDLKRIFEDFITLDSSFGRGSEGTGLGLAITRRIVESMGGEITCESEPGEGSLFSLIVPLPAAKATVNLDIQEQTADIHALRILVAEDNDINRELIKSMLEQQGHDVIVAPGGAEAVEACRNAAFDIILMDISMPEVDGIEAISRIRQAGLATGVEIVALTAHTAAEDHARILDAGFVEVVTKPISPQNLKSLLARRTDTAENSDSATGPSDITQFFTALGEDRARGFLSAFVNETEMFIADMEASATASEVQRKEAHRLAGSAAVLGLLDLRAVLADIELSEENSPSDPAELNRIWQETKPVVAPYLTDTSTSMA